MPCYDKASRTVLENVIQGQIDTNMQMPNIKKVKIM